MPLSINKVRVDVSLCGAIPRSWPLLPVPNEPAPPPSTPASERCQKLSEITSSDLNVFRDQISRCSCLATTNGKAPSTHPTLTSRSKTANKLVLGDHRPPQKIERGLLQARNSAFSTMHQARNNSMQLPVLEPPQWAVPARGEARLEPVCEALGSHPRVDLTSRPFFRIGRSPGSDIQLQHNTSSRRHALLFHHPNGSCYVVDCGSSHGTYVNGVRLQSTQTGCMVVPHRVRRGSLIRFGGPGAPAFVLKSFSVGFSSMVKDVDEPSEAPTIAPTPRPDKITVNTRINAMGSQEGGILRKRSFEDTSPPEAKRQRCVSPACNMDGPFRLVSPETPRKSKRVSFLEKPDAIFPTLVSPDELSSDDEDTKP